MVTKWTGIILLLFFVLSGAARGVAGELPDALLERGLKALRSGNGDEAQQTLRQYLAVAPDDTRQSEAWLALGQLALKRGEAEEALQFSRLIPEGQRSAAVVLLEGAALVASGRAEAGVALLQRLPQGLLDLNQQAEWLLALADGQRRLEHYLEAVVLYQQAQNLPLPGEIRDGILIQAHAVLRDRCNDAVLAEASYMLGESALGLDARLQQAQRAALIGSGEQARKIVDRILASRLPFRYRDEALLLRDRLSGKAWLQRSIGVMLPLSGRFAPYGTLVRRGIELAAAQHGREESPVTFIFRDVGQDPEENALALARLANEDRVMAILGPLTGGAALAAAQRAEMEKVPLLTLSQKDGLPEVGSYVFRNALTPRQQARVLVRYAVESRGLLRFAILAPENRLGEELAEAFAAEVVARGGKVVARQSYSDKATDFRRQVKLLLGEDPNQPDREEGERALGSQRAAKRKGPPPPFEALFVPDDAQRVELVAPQLAFYGLEDVQLLGSSGWNNPELPKVAGRFVDGAIFVDGFFLESQAPEIRLFVKGYRERYQSDPTILEAQGYDSAGMLLSVLARPEIRTRADLRQALEQLGGYAGVMGRIDIVAGTGEADKGLCLLQVEDDAIHPLF